MSRRPLLVALATAAAAWLYHFDAPLLDGMSIKQIFIAHKARVIAGPPFDPARTSFDFLDDDGRRLELTEEVPLYTGLLGLAYRLCGEREWLGRVLSIAAALVALAAFHDLTRRTFGRSTARVATALLAVCPLLLFYGRAVQPDACMLAGMLACAACYDRHLDRGRFGWLVAAALAGLLGALFKYYGLMVLVPLSVMTWQRRGGRGCVSWRFLALAAVLVVPVAVWTGAVFAAAPNPARAKPYFLFQMPELLWRPTLYLRFVDRFLFKDCGPVTAALVVVGVVAALRGRVNARPVYGWTVMGVLFFFGLGPLLRCHDYYELMMLPAAAVWAALGWQALWGRDGSAAPRIGAAVLLAAAVIHSPWLMGGKFELERGYRVLAERLQQVCPPGGRVVVLGPVEGADVIHYARREGWAYADLPRAADAPEALARWRRQGAACVAVYRNRPLSSKEEYAVRTLTAALPVREHAAGPWSAHGRWCEYTIWSLCDASDGPPAHQSALSCPRTARR